MCVFDGCPAPLFRSKRAWFRHELTTHRRQWTCILCSQTQESPQILRDHLLIVHQKQLAERQWSVLLEGCSRPIALFDLKDCPFCEPDIESLALGNEIMSAERFRSHLARHLEGVALLVLLNLGITHENTADTQISLADLSKTLEPDTQAESAMRVEPNPGVSSKDLVPKDLARDRQFHCSVQTCPRWTTGFYTSTDLRRHMVTSHSNDISTSFERLSPSCSNQGMYREAEIIYAGASDDSDDEDDDYLRTLSLPSFLWRTF